jgi:uncharacterized protein YggE
MHFSVYPEQLNPINLPLQEVVMKQLSTLLNFVLVCVLVCILVLLGLPDRTVKATEVTAVTDSCDASRAVHVSGTAVVNVTPDRALIQLGVQSNGTTPSEVKFLNTQAIEDVIDTIKSLGIDAKDIRTDHYIVRPIYENYNSLFIKGYRIDNLVAVTLRDVDKISDVIVAALEAGANEVVDVELYTSELRKYRDQARDMAMQAASEKAQALANTAGVDTGCVLTINENTWSYYNGWWSREQQNLWVQNAVQNINPSAGSAGSSQEGPVSLGQISIRAEVNASFGLQ